ncbi:MAG: DUF3459 domain-containing protein, partial [Candidatus Nanopelagicaceae bacterium]
LNLYREALRIRKTNSHLRDSFFRWVESTESRFIFSRRDDDAFLCIVTFDASETLPPDYEVLLSSQEIRTDQIPPDTAVWLQKR